MASGLPRRAPISRSCSPANRKTSAKAPLRQEMGRQDRHRLGVGLGPEGIAEFCQLTAQGLKIFDDAVMDNGYPVGCDRMGVGLGG